MLSEKSSSPGKSGNTTCCKRLISVGELGAVAIKHLVELSVEHEFFCHFFSKRKTCHGALMQFADSAGPDQPAHKHRLIRAFTVGLQNQWIL